MQMPLPQLPKFEYIRPGSPEAVTEALLAHPGGARLFMGGTDLLVQIRSGDISPDVLVDVKQLPGMTEIGFNAQTGLRVGAAATMNAVARHPDVNEHYPLLVEALETVASYQLRSRATIGGNLCNASPAADTAPACLVLEAELAVQGPGGERIIPAQDFFRGPGACALEQGEFLRWIDFPIPPEGWQGRYLKLGRNAGGDLAIVGVAVLGYADTVASGYSFRIALASVAPTPIRVPEAEQILTSSRLSPEIIEQAGDAAMRTAKPIGDVRASAEYRTAMIGALTQRAVSSVWHALQESD